MSSLLIPAFLALTRSEVKRPSPVLYRQHDAADGHVRLLAVVHPEPADSWLIDLRDSVEQRLA